jgi:hypothetical protein
VDFGRSVTGGLANSNSPNSVFLIAGFGVPSDSRFPGPWPFPKVSSAFLLSLFLLNNQKNYTLKLNGSWSQAGTCGGRLANWTLPRRSCSEAFLKSFLIRPSSTDRLTFDLGGFFKVSWIFSSEFLPFRNSFRPFFLGDSDCYLFDI